MTVYKFCQMRGSISPTLGPYIVLATGKSPVGGGYQRQSPNPVLLNGHAFAAHSKGYMRQVLIRFSVLFKKKFKKEKK